MSCAAPREKKMTLNNVDRSQMKTNNYKKLIQIRQYNLVLLDFVSENDVFPIAE